MIRVIIIIISAIAAVSCNTPRTKVAKLSGREISFDVRLRIIGDSTAMPDYKNEKVKLLIYYDSLGCNTCRIQNLNDWKILVDEAKDLNGLLGIHIIFTPRSKAPDEIPRLLRLENFQHPVYIDYTGEFYNRNKDLINNYGDVSLLDKDNRIVLVGNPVSNEAMWELFQATLDNMLANDGIYVPEK